MTRHLVAALAFLVALPLSGTLSGSPAAAEDAGAFSETRAVTRAQGTASNVVESQTVTVKVDHTTNLRARERVRVTWSGARPSAGRASEPRGASGAAGFTAMDQEYPVVILQCRGTAETISPETCWTNFQSQRYVGFSNGQAVWRHDLFATDAQRAQTSGTELLDPAPPECIPPPFLNQSVHFTPFKAADGTVYAFCNTSSTPPEGGDNPTVPPADVAAFTASDGTGSWDFEVRTEVENRSLGCSESVDCSLVVIPVMGISCMDTDATCNKTGGQLPGGVLTDQLPVDEAVAGRYWWAESNWRNRFVVPLTFAPPPDFCDVLDDRESTSFFGSELLNQATLQWAPAFCLAKDRFKFNHLRMADGPAFRLVDSGSEVAAFVSDTQEHTGPEPLAYAPTAVTGFAISFVADLPNNSGEVEHLKLNPRLLAKLLTQSYPSMVSIRAHPGLEDNPLTIQSDPEFTALNPGLAWFKDGLAQIQVPSAAVLMMLNESSDVVQALTTYIAADKDAMDFINGEADPNGMKVNPNYRGLELPVAQWPLLDDFYQPPSACIDALTPDPYLSRLAAPVKGLATITTALLDQRPTAITDCQDAPELSPPYVLKRAPRQPFGGRFLLGLTSLGDARRYGLRTASLAGADGTYVDATDDALAKAVEKAVPGTTDEAFALDAGELSKTEGAYPGAQIVYTVARTHGLAKADASRVAQFIRVATSEGQVQGSGNGQLPEGYLPLTEDGVTAALWDRAQEAADLIEKQQGKAAVTPGGPSTGMPGASSVPPAGTADATGQPAPNTVAGPRFDTVSLHSSTGAILFPLLLAIAVAAGVAGPAVRLADYLRRAR